MKKKTKGKTFIIIISSVLAVTLLGSLAFNLFPTKKDEGTKPGIEDILPDEPGVETPDVPEEPNEPEVVEPMSISVDNISYTSVSGATDYSSKLNKVLMSDIENKINIATGDVLSIRWNSGALVTLNIDLNNIDLTKYTHLTFVFGSEPLVYTDGYAKFVQDPVKTVFKTGKYFISNDANYDNSVANKPGTTIDDFLKLGEWKKFEIPVEDVLECFNTNGKINLFHFMSNGLTTSTLYLADINFENLAQ